MIFPGREHFCAQVRDGSGAGWMSREVPSATGRDISHRATRWARGSTDVGHRCLGRAMKRDQNPDHECSPRRILNFSHKNSQTHSICDLGHIQWPEPVNMSFRLGAHPCFAEHIRWLLALGIVLGLAFVPCPKGAAPMTAARPARWSARRNVAKSLGVTSPSLAAKLHTVAASH